jgi:hypothetical protein
MAVIVVAGSNNGNRFAVIDFTIPASPTNVLATPTFLGGCMVDCSGTLAAVGNYNGGEVEIFDISNPALPVQTGSVSTALNGIGAISFDGPRIVVMIGQARLANAPQSARHSDRAALRFAASFPLLGP